MIIQKKFNSRLIHTKKKRPRIDRFVLATIEAIEFVKKSAKKKYDEFFRKFGREHIFKKVHAFLTIALNAFISLLHT